ncbi:uncharacterized protein TM35_000491320 [Trypanosoma theileri]|uniref:Transmembrane protein n=1 Tax=Trypanosoma theileri TaxID=67003 RepID=A0A1X0NHH2_9TRYP|nr:uncharacterized protein TM35_000491320 [Trypanosoma theileri]ORC84126.1 hypothetical protein TM35_000491320 [Trypanosoma theileri]
MGQPSTEWINWGSENEWVERDTSISAAMSSNWRLRIVRIASLVFTLAAFTLFVLGLSNNSRLIVGVDGWDEVFAVIGSYWFVPAAIAVYHFSSHLSFFTQETETRLSFYILQTLLLLAYLVQQGLFMAYLVTHVGRLCWIFIVPDFIVASMMMTTFQRILFVRQWPMIYILTQAGKLATLWPQMNDKLANSTRLGPDGLLGTLMLTILIVQLPVLISRLHAGTSLTKAYTTNMAAVFAHVLHFMDVLELYFTVLELQDITSDVQQLVLFFAVMGHITCNMYYAVLFLKDEATLEFLRRFEGPNQGGTDLIGITEPAKDDELLHYFLWTFFFIDLPYAVLRLVELAVNGKDVSVFFGKNFMMIVGVVMLLLRGKGS